MTTSAQALDRILDAVATLTAALGDAHGEATLATLEPALHRLDRAVSRACTLALLSPDLRVHEQVPDAYFDPIDEGDHLLAVEELRRITAIPLEPVTVHIVIAGGITGLGRAVARTIAGHHIARPVEGQLRLDLTQRVSAVVSEMGTRPEAVVEDAIDPVDEDDDGEYVISDSPALITLRRAVGRRW